jgi:hypothetical protein
LRKGSRSRQTHTGEQPRLRRRPLIHLTCPSPSEHTYDDTL